MKCYVFIFHCFFYLCDVFALENFEGWNYINLHCRDDGNKPVDWWYMYKPPNDVGELESGRQFNFITPDTGGRWRLSDRFITANSMLQHTLSPLFRPTYTDYLAMVVYDEQKNYGTKNGSSGYGVLMADEMGGIWLGHTVPGLPDMTLDRPTFPEEEIANGHMVMCLSLDLITINEVAAALRKMSPRVTRIRVPPAMRTSLPDWQYMDVPLNAPLNFESKPLQFLTKSKSLRAVMIVRSPGDRRCLYKTFARSRSIVLDIYGHDTRRNPICGVHYSIRNINEISLKYPEQKVYYINNKMDRIGFAVSTAAHWQSRGFGSPQYWTCTSNIEKEDATPKGGLILCVDDYHVWLSFDNLKIKEPEC